MAVTPVPAPCQTLPEPAPAPMSPVTRAASITEESPDWSPVTELPESETMPAPTPKQEDQDHELQHMSPTPRILEEAAAFLEAQGSKAAATDLGADNTPPLCRAVANCSLNVTPVNFEAPASSWTPCPTPSQSRETSPRSHPRGTAGDDEVKQGQMLTSGIRKLPESSRMVLEPLWLHARSIIWLLKVRKRVQDDSSFLNARGLHQTSLGGIRLWSALLLHKIWTNRKTQ